MARIRRARPHLERTHNRVAGAHAAADERRGGRGRQLRIRQAVAAGELGPIIDVEDPDGDGVLISLE